MSLLQVKTLIEQKLSSAESLLKIIQSILEGEDISKIDYCKYHSLLEYYTHLKKIYHRNVKYSRSEMHPDRPSYTLISALRIRATDARKEMAACNCSTCQKYPSRKRVKCLL